LTSKEVFPGGIVLIKKLFVVLMLLFSTATIVAEDNGSLVKGYVKDSSTLLPIEKARVVINNRSTFTDSSGFYSMKVNPGIISIRVTAYGYFANFTEDRIGKNERKWINFSLYPHPVERSKVQGYVKDFYSKEPIKGVNINLTWHKKGYFIYKNTTTDKNGFYALPVAVGEVKIRFSAKGYLEERAFYTIEKDYQTLTIDIFLHPRPLEDSEVRGYINVNASINLTWSDEKGHFLYYKSFGNSYSIKVPAGNICIEVSAPGYFIERKEFYIGEGETRSLDFFLVPRSPENSEIKGFIFNERTGNFISNARIELFWEDNYGHSLHNTTFSNSKGFYSFKVSPGKVYLLVSTPHFFKRKTKEYTVKENESLTINISLKPYPEEVEIKGYVRNGKDIRSEVNISWQDILFKRVFTDSKGFFSIKIPRGKILIRVSAEGHFPEKRVLFVDEDLYVNFSLTPYPQERSTIAGYVTYKNNPVQNVYINLRWEDGKGHTLYKSTYSNSQGFFTFKVGAGKIRLYFFARGYLRKYSYFIIKDYDALTINAELRTPPRENSILEGYVNVDATINLTWKDKDGNFLYNSTLSYGYYSIRVPAGYLYVRVSSEGYLKEERGWLPIGDKERLRLDFSLISYEENSTIAGFVTSAGKPIKNAYVNLTWSKNGHTIYNSTITNSQGYYLFRVAPGNLTLRFEADGFLKKTCIYKVGNFESVNGDVSLIPYPPEKYRVFGTVTFEKKPISAIVNLTWRYLENYLFKSVRTDSQGFYSIRIPTGYVFIEVQANGYFSEYRDWQFIDKETKIDFSLTPIPKEHSTVEGFVTHGGFPIKGAVIDLTWRDEKGHFLCNKTLTDYSGYYKIRVAEGNISIEVRAKGYLKERKVREISKGEVLLINFSLTPSPLENSVIEGLITSNGSPVKEAVINLTWSDEKGHFLYNRTLTDYNGYYRINAPAGNISISVLKEGYFKESETLNIKEGERIRKDFTLIAYPSENSFVMGYVTFRDKGIGGVYVNLSWQDELGHYLFNTTFTQPNGFFGMRVGAGKVKLFFKAEDFLPKNTSLYPIGEHDVLSLNVSLLPYPSESLVLEGYVTDNVTQEGIEDAEINLSWRSEGSFYYNSTKTKRNGFFKIRVAPGYITLKIMAEGYLQKTISRIVSKSQTILLSLDPILPPQNCTVKGFIFNALTYMPIENASIKLGWKYKSTYIYNFTRTNEFGYYSMRVASGEISIVVNATNYFSKSRKFEISDSVWSNFSLYPRPREDFTIKGYVTNKETNEPIKNAKINLIWKDEYGNRICKESSTNASGFYIIKKVPFGNISLTFKASNYFQKTLSLNINESKWVNVSLYSSKVEVKIIKPEKALYIRNKKIIPSNIPFILFYIEVKVEASHATQKVVFQLDGKKQKIDTTRPFTWVWDTPSLGKHIIEVIGYNKLNESNFDRIEVLKFF
jgi:5-hydroxyisourate hydrolase-like protein (transthyretin family)